MTLAISLHLINCCSIIIICKKCNRLKISTQKINKSSCLKIFSHLQADMCTFACSQLFFWGGRERDFAPRHQIRPIIRQHVNSQNYMTGGCSLPTENWKQKGPPRPFPGCWHSRRIWAGTKLSTLSFQWHSILPSCLSSLPPQPSRSAVAPAEHTSPPNTVLGIHWLLTLIIMKT